MVYQLHDACRKAAGVIVWHMHAISLLPMQKSALYQEDPDHSTFGSRPYVFVVCMPGQR